MPRTGGAYESIQRGKEDGAFQVAAAHRMSEKKTAPGGLKTRGAVLLALEEYGYCAGASSFLGRSRFMYWVLSTPSFTSLPESSESSSD